MRKKRTFVLKLRRIMYILFSMILFSISTGCKSETTPTTHLNLRETPTAQSEDNILRVLTPTEKLEITSYKGKWMKIKVVETGERGWVYSSYVNSISANFKVGNVSILGMILTAILTSLFGLLLAAFAIKASQDGGSYGNPDIAISISGGILLGAFQAANIIASVATWKIVVASVIGIIVDIIITAIIDADEIGRSIILYLIGIAIFPLLLLLLKDNYYAVQGLVESLLRIQDMLSFFEKTMQ